MKVWEKLKSESKIYYNTCKRDVTQTGGGPSVVKIDPLLEQVCAIVGRGCTGIIGIPDTDYSDDEKTVKKVDAIPKVICLNNDDIIPIETVATTPLNTAHVSYCLYTI